jgi:hypothetical protein
MSYKYNGTPISDLTVEEAVSMIENTSGWECYLPQLGENIHSEKIIMAALTRNAMSLKYLDKSAYHNKNFVMYAVSKIPESIEYSSYGMRKDSDVLTMYNKTIR